MTTTDTPTGQQPALDRGQQLLDQLRTDGSPLPITAPELHRLGCLLSALAVHITDEQWSTVAGLNPPGELGAHLELRCGPAEVAAAVVGILPWRNPPILRREPGDTDVHAVTRGVLWDRRIAVVGLEPLGGAS